MQLDVSIKVKLHEITGMIIQDYERNHGNILYDSHLEKGTRIFFSHSRLVIDWITNFLLSGT